MTAIATRSWDEIRQYYLSFGEGAWLSRHRPMLNLVSWLEEEKVSGEVFGTVGLSGLLLSNQAKFNWGEHMLQITIMPTPGFMLFEYYRAPGSTDGMKKQVPVEESVECLRQFLAYKFGIHRPPNNGLNRVPEQIPTTK
jgi:hypothetical protein